MGVGVGGIEGRGPPPFGGGGYVPGGGGMYCGARVRKGVNDKLVMFDTMQNARGICGIGDAAYIADRWVGYRSATGRQLLTLCVWWYGGGIRHRLHERCRHEGTRWWGAHPRHDRLRPSVSSHNGVKNYNFLPVRGSKERK